MKHTVPHDLDLDTAKKATAKALESYKERFSDYQPEVSWLDERRAEVQFKALGATLKGLFQLTPSAVEMEMDVPLRFKLFQKKAVDVVDREIKKWIEKAKQGELE